MESSETQVRMSAQQESASELASQAGCQLEALMLQSQGEGSRDFLGHISNICELAVRRRRRFPFVLDQPFLRR